MKIRFVKRLICVLLSLVLTVGTVTAYAGEVRKNPYLLAMESRTSTQELISEFLSHLDRGVDITILDTDGNTQGEAGYSLRGLYAYVLGNILPDLFGVPLESIGLNGTGLFFKKDGQTGVLTVESVLSALSAALPAAQAGTDMQKDAELLAAMAGELLAGLMGVIPQPVQQADGSVLMTVSFRQLTEQLVNTVGGILTGHQAEADALIGRWYPVFSSVFPDLQPFTVDDLLAGLNSLYAFTAYLPFDTVSTSLTAGDHLQLRTSVDGMTVLEISADRVNGEGYVSVLGGTAYLQWTSERYRNAARFVLNVNDVSVFDFVVACDGDRYTANGSIMSSGFYLLVDPQNRRASLDMTEPDMHADIRVSGTGFSLTVAKDDSLFDVHGLFTDTEKEITATWNDVLLLRFMCEQMYDVPGYHISLNVGSGLTYTGDVYILSDGIEMTGNVNGTSVSLSGMSVDNGVSFVLTAGSHRFYGSMTTEGNGIAGFFRNQSGSFNLILCHNAWTLSAVAGKGQLQIRADGRDAGHFEMDLSPRTGEGYALVQIPEPAYGNWRNWNEMMFSWKDTAFVFDESSITSLNGRTEKTVMYHIAVEDLTPIPDAYEPVISEHYNITSVTWSGRMFDYLSLPCYGYLFVTDKPEQNLRVTDVSTLLSDGSWMPVFTLKTDYSQNTWPFDGNETALLTLEQILAMLGQE